MPSRLAFDIRTVLKGHKKENIAVSPSSTGRASGEQDSLLGRPHFLPTSTAGKTLISQGSSDISKLNLKSAVQPLSVGKANCVYQSVSTGDLCEGDTPRGVARLPVISRSRALCCCICTSIFLIVIGILAIVNLSQRQRVDGGLAFHGSSKMVEAPQQGQLKSKVVSTVNLLPKQDCHTQGAPPTSTAAAAELSPSPAPKSCRRRAPRQAQTQCRRRRRRRRLTRRLCPLQHCRRPLQHCRRPLQHCRRRRRRQLQTPTLQVAYCQRRLPPS